eukprot:6174935-Pleurochrysis_carterae.AAC.1
MNAITHVEPRSWISLLTKRTSAVEKEPATGACHELIDGKSKLLYSVASTNKHCLTLSISSLARHCTLASCSEI